MQLKLSTICTTLAVCALAFFEAQANATVIINYPNFSSTAGLTIVGNAGTAVTGDGTVLRVTPAALGQAGAAYSNTSVGLGVNDAFSTQFQFRFSNVGGVDPADGITFVLAAATAGLGDSGYAIGYGGVANSVAIEFDTFFNGGVDTSSNHVAIDTGGNVNDLALNNVYGIVNCALGNNTTAGCMSNGNLWTANISYDGANLTVKLFDPAVGTTFTAIDSYAINLASVLGQSTAFVGFTSGTGSGWENHDIINWQFSNSSTLTSSSPEPASLLLFGAGAIVMAVFGRRVRRGHIMHRAS